MRAKLDSFFHDIGYRLKIANDTKKRLDKRLASSFSLFPYIAPNENLISKIIRDLLDPNGNHGQGDIFLQKFLETIGKPELYESGDHSFIRIEECTTNIENNKRRIDILIEIKRNGQHHAGIAIENKPWATDQAQQIDDYLDHIRKKHPNYYIIYLTQNGDEPSDHSAIKTKTEEKEKLITMSYKDDMTVWLEACHKESQAEYVRQFLLDFSNYCHQPNLSYTSMQNLEIEEKSLIDYLFEKNNQHRLSLALSICAASEKIKEEALINFTEKLERKIKIIFPEYETESNLSEQKTKETELSITKPNWCCHIILSSDKKNSNNLSIGVYLKDGFKRITKRNFKLDASAKKAITQDLVKNYSSSGESTNNGWIYWTYLEKYRNWNETNFLMSSIENPEPIISYIIDQFKKIEGIIKKYPEILI